MEMLKRFACNRSGIASKRCGTTGSFLLRPHNFPIQSDVTEVKKIQQLPAFTGKNHSGNEKERKQQHEVQTLCRSQRRAVFPATSREAAGSGWEVRVWKQENKRVRPHAAVLAFISTTIGRALLLQQTGAVTLIFFVFFRQMLTTTL